MELKENEPLPDETSPTIKTTTHGETAVSEASAQEKQPEDGDDGQRDGQRDGGGDTGGIGLRCKRKLSCTSTTTTGAARPLKMVPPSGGPSEPAPSQLAFDFSKPSAHILASEPPHRIFSNETVKQHLFSRLTHLPDRRQLAPHETSNPSSNPAPIPPSITLSLFSHLADPHLTWPAKLACFGATLGINFLLPFINGVMLGFGEIAAREFLGAYLGWGPAGARYYRSGPDRQRPPARKPTSVSDGPLDSSAPSFTHHHPPS